MQYNKYLWTSILFINIYDQVDGLLYRSRLDKIISKIKKFEKYRYNSRILTDISYFRKCNLDLSSYIKLNDFTSLVKSLAVNYINDYLSNDLCVSSYLIWFGGDIILKNYNKSGDLTLKLSNSTKFVCKIPSTASIATSVNGGNRGNHIVSDKLKPDIEVSSIAISKNLDMVETNYYSLMNLVRDNLVCPNYIKLYNL